ncbi:MAG: hypothetical protein ACRD0Y_13335 [Terriglobales bacterium]
MGRTTIAIDEVVLREIKQRAAKKGTTLQAEVNQLLRKALTSKSRAESGYKLEIEGWNGVLKPGVDICDRDSLFRAMEGR